MEKEGREERKRMRVTDDTYAKPYCDKFDESERPFSSAARPSPLNLVNSMQVPSIAYAEARNRSFVRLGVVPRMRAHSPESEQATVPSYIDSPATSPTDGVEAHMHAQERDGN